MARRKDVVAAAVEEGLNPKTANTQYGHWKRANYPVVKAVATSPPEEDEPDRHWARLLKNGFTYGADWVLENGNPTLDRPAPAEPGVYVFVLEDSAVYVGVTRRPLAARMADYRRGPVGQRTSSRIKALIASHLADGHSIRVLFAVPGQSEWNGLPVEIAAGLEAGLISDLLPAWNIKGTFL
ncbi:hypothetical protein HKCCE2091_10115 [Rhodobacterales bacterium HKCCE2091]|nr:hypothetical protein [Rhodobacterales bacterium HKCCE2091]